MTRPRTTVARTPSAPARLALYYVDSVTSAVLCSTDGREWILPAVGSSLGVPGVAGKCVVVGVRRIDERTWDVVVERRPTEDEATNDRSN